MGRLVGDPQGAPHTKGGMKLTWSPEAIDDLISLRAQISMDDLRLQRDNYDGRLPTIKLAKSGSRRVARRELPV